MALSFVGGKVAIFAGTTGETSISLTDLTGGSDTAPAADDIVLIAYAVGAQADRSIGVATEGYTEEQELYANGSTYDANLSVSWKKMGGTPDTSVNVSGTGSSFNAGAVAIHVWRGQDLSTPFDVAETTATGTGAGRPNPASITPTTAGAVAIVAGAGAAGTGAVFTASELSNFFTDTSPDGEDAIVGLGSYAWTLGAFDPVAWTGGTTNAADSWAAVTLALRPAATSQSLTPSLFTNSQTFYSPTVAPGAVTIAPSLSTNTQTFHSPAVTPGAVTLSPSLLANGQTFYAATVAQGTATLSPSLFTSAQAFYSATVSPGAVGLASPLFTNGPSFYGPTAAPGTVALAPSLLANAQTFHSADLEQGEAPPAPETSPERILTLSGHSRTVTIPRLSIRGLRPAPIGRRLPVPQLVRTVVCDATPPRLLAVPRDNPRQLIA